MSFTNDSIYLRNQITPSVNVKETNELKLLYNHLDKVKIKDFKKYYQSTNVKQEKLIQAFTKSHMIHKSEKLKNTMKIKLKDNDFRITINIHSNEKNDLFIHEIIHVIKYVCSLSASPIKDLTINYYLLDLKKIFQMNEYLDVDEINSGACKYNSKTSSTIYIYRKEEILKVTIHELFHALRYDYTCGIDPEKIIKYYRKKYNITSEKINTNEAYTEIWANIINCFLLSQKMKRNQYHAFIYMIHLEKEFVLYQCNKISSFYNIPIKEQDLNKHTNVLSYFFIRCELFNKLTGFLKFCRLNNTKYVKLKNKNKWYEHLKKNKKLSFQSKPLKNDYIDITTRMSLNELNLF